MNQVLTRRTRLPLTGRLRRRRRADTRAPIGRDFSDSRIATSGRRWWAGLLAGGVLAALLMVHVRVRLIEEGYQRAAAIEKIEVLLAKRQVLKAETGALRNRNRLTSLAAERGFGKPQREIWLSQPTGRRRVEQQPTELRP